MEVTPRRQHVRGQRREALRTSGHLVVEAARADFEALLAAGYRISVQRGAHETDRRLQLEPDLLRPVSLVATKKAVALRAAFEKHPGVRALICQLAGA